MRAVGRLTHPAPPRGEGEDRRRAGLSPRSPNEVGSSLPLPPGAPLLPARAAILLLPLLVSTACGPGEQQPPDAPGAERTEPAPEPADATERTRKSDPRLSSRKPLIPGPRPIETGPWSVDQLSWAGWRLVGADSQGDSSVLLAWDDPEKPPRELARIPGRVQGLAPAPDGRRVAVEAAYPENPALWSLEDPASLLVLELDSGRVRTLVGATQGASLRGACWSPDSLRIAIPSLERAERLPRRAIVRVLDADTGSTVGETDPALRLEPMRWGADGLMLRRTDPLGGEGGPAYRWHPGAGEPEPVETLPWPSPDGRYLLEAVPGGLQVRRGQRQPRAFEPSGERDSEALRLWSLDGRPAWCGTHHLAILVGQEVLSLDLASLEWQPLAPVGAGLPQADRSGHRLILQAGAEPWWGWAP